MCPRSPSQRVEELGFSPAALDPVPTAPSTGPGWLGSLPAGLCPQTSSLNPRLPTGTGSPDHEHEGLHGSQRGMCPSWHHRPYTLWSQAGALAGKGRVGAARKKPPDSQSYRWKKRRDGEPHWPPWGVLVPRRNGLNGSMPENRDGDRGLL